MKQAEIITILSKPTEAVRPDWPWSSGDVSGHGVSSALLMATARALIMLRASMPGDAAGVIN